MNKRRKQMRGFTQALERLGPDVDKRQRKKDAKQIMTKLRGIVEPAKAKPPLRRPEFARRRTQ
jgi:hypothetical protein